MKDTAEDFCKELNEVKNELDDLHGDDDNEDRNDSIDDQCQRRGEPREAFTDERKEHIKNPL